jgi:hypothetical protein
VAEALEVLVRVPLPGPLVAVRFVRRLNRFASATLPSSGAGRS